MDKSDISTETEAFGLRDSDAMRKHWVKACFARYCCCGGMDTLRDIREGIGTELYEDNSSLVTDLKKIKFFLNAQLHFTLVPVSL